MKDIAKFFFELGKLKMVKRSGWWSAGVKDPETVAEHSYRTTIIARILAELENADVDKVTTMILIHDIPETRINDIPKLGARYIDKDKVEKTAFKEQLERLPKKIADEFLSLYQEMQERKTKEAIIAKDADLLECAMQAKKYLDIGYRDTLDWIHNAEKGLKTKSAKEIIKIVKNMDSNEWWHGLKYIDHIKGSKHKH